MVRLYDPTEGMILVNDQDIKTFKLTDLRESMAILFQDYTHFPLTVRRFCPNPHSASRSRMTQVKDNIALGDPRNAHDETRIREAARLGGAEEFIDKMNKGFNTYLNRPVQDYWSIPSNVNTRSGVKLDLDLFRKAIGRVEDEDSVKLSGGQMQRLAV